MHVPNVTTNVVRFVLVVVWIAVSGGTVRTVCFFATRRSDAERVFGRRVYEYRGKEREGRTAGAVCLWSSGAWL